MIAFMVIGHDSPYTGRAFADPHSIDKSSNGLMQQLTHYIDGRLIEPLCGKYLDNIDPSTGQVYSLVPDGDAADVDRAVEAAVRAFPSWSHAPAAERSRIMLRVADLIDAN